MATPQIPWQKRETLSVEQAADILSVSRRHLYNLLSAGEVRGLRLGTKHIISTKEIQRLLNKANPRKRSHRPGNLPAAEA